jgi:hypothetical protein
MDRQMCSLTFQSSAHPKEEVTYVWKNDSYLAFVQGLDYQDRMTPDLRLLGYKLTLVDSRPDELTGSVYTQFVVQVFLERPLGFFIWEVYMPASFIVTMSFTSFWFDRAATPARVSLGVTTVLTMTTLLSSANNNLPPTAYPKVRKNKLKAQQKSARKFKPIQTHSNPFLLILQAIGVFLAGCFLFTFLALMEFSVASYLERRKTTQKLLQMSRQVRKKGRCCITS